MNPKRILIADDEEETRFSLSILMERAGYQATTVANGREALSRIIKASANGSRYDLLICDVHMPELNGEELIRELIEKKINLPVLVITGYGEKELLIRLMRMGCCRGYLDKPFNPEDIEQQVKKLMNNIADEAIEKERTETLARLGLRARETAHDMNNALATAMGYTDLALEELDKENPVRVHLKKVFKSAFLAEKICQRLLTRHDATGACCKERTQINILVERMVTVLQNIIPHNIKLKTDLTKEQIWLDADAEQIEQVLLNLTINASQAMPDGGIVEISLFANRSPGFENTGKDGSVKENDNWAELSIRDTGSGITEETLQHMFDEGYTTKKHGNGIGLCAIKRIVEQHDGLMKVKSTLGEGTVFDLYFPHRTRNN